jgi:hypothetical protein
VTWLLPEKRLPNQSILFRTMLATMCIVGLELGGLPGVFAAEGSKEKHETDLRAPPTDGKTPIDVAVGLYVTNFVAIDETRETFEVGGYLIGRWNDPRLALAAGQNSNGSNDQKPERVLRVEDVWTPPIEAANSISHKTNSYVLEADKNGEVTYIERFDAVLSNDFALRKFPFDTQVLGSSFNRSSRLTRRSDLLRKRYRQRESAPNSRPNWQPGTSRNCATRQKKSPKMGCYQKRARLCFKSLLNAGPGFISGRYFCRY